MTETSQPELAIDEITVLPQIRERFEESSIDGMAQSIREVGILQPIRIRLEGGQRIIVDGERRFRAAKRVGLLTVPVVIEEQPLSEADVIQRSLVANCQREDLTPLEKARAMATLMRATGSQAGEVATKCGLSNATVTRTLALLTLPEAIRERVNSGQIPASAAYELARVKDPQQQSELAYQLAAGRLTRDGLAGALKARRKGGGVLSAAKPRRAIAFLGAGRSVTVVGDCSTLDAFIEALEEALAKARKARPQGLALTTFCKMLKDQAAG